MNLCLPGQENLLSSVEKKEAEKSLLTRSWLLLTSRNETWRQPRALNITNIIVFEPWMLLICIFRDKLLKLVIVILLGFSIENSIVCLFKGVPSVICCEPTFAMLCNVPFTTAPSASYCRRFALASRMGTICGQRAFNPAASAMPAALYDLSLTMR
jgi:hypothetical protein